mmetsp:Transcript_17586/g.48612  ORF Transcript_17586/g.48612 Transcript_17586/m.48612 type:complete len:259 (-) Transcript_17586:324-1100(-)
MEIMVLSTSAREVNWDPLARFQKAVPSTIQSERASGSRNVARTTPISITNSTEPGEKFAASTTFVFVFVESFRSRDSNNRRGAGNSSGSIDREDGSGRRSIIKGTRAPPPTRNPEAHATIRIVSTTIVPVVPCREAELLASCNSNRAQTAGIIKKLLRRSEEKPNPDPTGGESATDGVSRPSMSFMSEGLNQREFGSIPGAHQYQYSVSRKARLPYPITRSIRLSNNQSRYSLLFLSSLFLLLLALVPLDTPVPVSGS